jgi:DNA polymerase I-like protein with 3'-5' exonuclease and polymerase domains
VERTYARPREEMIEKVHRNAGKVLNFSSAYGASPASLERKIESDTGVKPEPGTGQKGLEAIAARQPRATQFLEEMAEIPSRGGTYRAASGRIRHCSVHGDGVDVSWRTRKSIESAIGREFRNFPMQESVAATAARACKWALEVYKQLGLKASPVVCLYDSLVTMCPYEERFIVSKLHQVFLSDINGWEYDGVYGKRVLKYGIDTEFNERWSTNVKTYQKQMEDPDYHPTPDHLKWILDFENWDLLVS